MEQIDIKLENGFFNYNGEECNCNFIIEEELKEIIRNAETDHKEVLNRDYNTDSLEAKAIELYLDKDGDAVFGRIRYRINYTEEYQQESGFEGRDAIGNFHKIIRSKHSKWPLIICNGYQCSICW